MVVLYYKSLPFQVWQLVIAFGEVKTYHFLFVAWLHVATWSQSHVNLLVVVPHLNSPVCQVWIWYILIFNVRKKIRMIILLQSVTIKFRRFFWHISYCKVRQSNFIIKCVSYYKLWQILLQIVWRITKRNSYYKVKRNKTSLPEIFPRIN